MNNEVKCEKCKNILFEVPSFAMSIDKGRSTQKWNNFIELECTNQECENFNKLITLKHNE